MTNNINKDLSAAEYYAEIIHAPHWEPKVSHGRVKHPRMPMEKHAAIFASFDALSGYKDATTETARQTDKRIELSESAKEKLDQRLSFLIDRMEEGMLPEDIISADRKETETGSGSLPPVTITYFSPTRKKTAENIEVLRES